MAEMALPKPKPSKAVQQKLKVEKAAVYAKNKEKVLQHLQKRGLRNKAIAAIMANIDVETGGSFDFKQKQTKSGSPSDPRIIEGGGVGLFQFDDYQKGVGNQSWYKEYLKDSGKKDSTESQIDYVLDSVFAKNEKDIGWKSKLKIGKGDLEVLEQYLTTTENPRDISDAFVDRFEKAGIPHSDKRRNKTDQYLAELQPVDKTDSFPLDRVIETSEEKNRFRNVPFLRYKPVQDFFGLAEGGAVPMKEQMELFQDGGLRDQGGTIDPVSGNNVPPGSLQEEVRDDIPAQLSEGEFVFPADVVRYIGLEKLMQMRQEAKVALSQMEAMGQMGNSDEASIPDNLPFDIYDLDVEDDPVEMQTGGVVPGVQTQQGFTGISGFQPAQFQSGATSGFVSAPVPQFPTTQPVQPAPVPIAQPPQQMPTFEDFTEKNVETVEYTNTETGEKRVFTFIGGQPTVPIPAGFVPSSEYVQPETAVPEDVTVASTSVLQPEGGDDEARMRREEEMFGPGGGRLGIQGKTYGVSFDGINPLTDGRGLLGGLIFGGKIPDDLVNDVTVSFKRGDTEFDVDGSNYNELKDVIQKHGANSPNAQRKITELQTLSNAREDARISSERERGREVEAVGEDFADTAGPGSGMASQTLTAAEQRRAAQRVKERQRRQNILSDQERRQGSQLNITPGPREAERLTREVARESRASQEGPGSGMAPQTRQDPGRDRGPGRESFGREGGMGGRFRAKGGLMEAPKPKKKKMKRGGLASKK
jgi:hypothetical protein